jgi:K+-transporting ATPase KdpF subunit
MESALNRICADERFHDRFDFNCDCTDLLRRIGTPAEQDRKSTMTLYVIVGLIAAGLLIYLFIALLWPEVFS